MFKGFLFALFVILALAEPKIIFNKGVDAPTNYIGENHDFTIMYTLYNVGEDAAYNVTINDQWPAEGFDHNGAYPIFIEEIPAGEKYEYNVTATPRQSGYLETARAQLSYLYIDEQEESHVHNAFSSTIGTLPILPEAQYINATKDTRLAWSIFGLGCVLVVLYPLYRYIFSSNKQKTN